MYYHKLVISLVGFVAIGSSQAATVLQDEGIATYSSDEGSYDNTYGTGSTNNGVGAFRSFGFRFDSSIFVNKTGSGTLPGAPQIGSPNVFADMQSISIKGAAGGTGTSGTYYLLVYEGKANPNDLNTSGTLVGSSTNSISYNVGSTNNFTFNFADMLLDTSKEYTFVFSTSADSITGLTGNNQGVRMNYINGGADSAWIQGGASHSSSLTDNRTLTGLGMEFETVVVPESSSAAFALLACGGLAWRRRRSAC